ncbi:MAG: hypothetical protein JWO38_5333 [Gemmataceae bacterium]|nr:hypothetical protein [Gemmataceae bacterium]
MGAAGFLAGPPVPFASYRATWYPDQPVSGQGTKLGYLQEDFLASAPVFLTKTDQLTVRASVRNEAFNTGAVLPDSARAFPDALWNVQTGLNYTHRFDNNWVAGGMLNLGSASDKPFHSIDEMTIGGGGFLRVPSGDRNAWLFTLSYSPTGQIAFPVPGVAYFYQPSDRFYATIGLPLQINYRPIDDLMLDFSYMLLTNMHAGATYRVSSISPRLFLHGGFDWKNESYFLADRTDRQERLFYYDKTLSAGTRYNFNRSMFLDLTCGYAFDRYYFTGRSLSDSHHDRVDVGAGPFAAIQFQGRW